MNRWTSTLALTIALLAPVPVAGLQLSVEVPEAMSSGPLDGRVLVLISTNDEREPRFQVSWGVDSAQVFGVDVDGLEPGGRVILDADTFGYPVHRLADLPAGEYWVQAVLHKYATFDRSDGHRVKLPASWAAGQQWNREPGNLFSVATKVWLDGAEEATVEFILSEEIPPLERPEDTEFIKHIEIRSKLLSDSGGATCTSALTCCCQTASTRTPKSASP